MGCLATSETGRDHRGTRNGTSRQNGTGPTYPPRGCRVVPWSRGGAASIFPYRPHFTALPSIARLSTVGTSRPRAGANLCIIQATHRNPNLTYIANTVFLSRAGAHEARSKGKMMDHDIEQLRADMMTGRKAIAETIVRLNKDGAHPAMAIEGALIAILEASATIQSVGALVDWLRDAADHVEAFALTRIGSAG
jgi:hypothetical protein